MNPTYTPSVKHKVYKRSLRSSMWLERLLAYLFLAPSLLLFGIFLFYPLVKPLYLSLYLTDPRGRVSQYVGLDNFTNLLTSELFYKSIQVTLLFILYTVPTGILLALLLAGLAQNKLRGIRIFRFIFSLPMAISVGCIDDRVEFSFCRYHYSLFLLVLGLKPLVRGITTGAFNQGQDLIDNGNGRTSPATSSLLNNEAGVKTLKWWKKMLDDKSLINLGRKTDDTKKAFAAGQIDMTLDSTASLRGIVTASEGEFEVGTSPLPRPEAGKKGGVIVGGASLWIMNNRSESEQQGAWEFIKFLASPTTQAYWHVNTGYFPITLKAYDEQIVKDNLTKYPQFQTAVDQLHQTTPSQATQGAVMGVFPEARQLTETAIEEVLNNNKSPEQALDNAAKEITNKIQEYNQTISK